MQCPGCNNNLRTITYEGIKIETCPGCHGEWLDGCELLQVVKAREVRFDKDERRAIAVATKITGVDLVAADRNLPCPKCAGRTDAVNYGGDSGIIIDRCPSCKGVWLDAGELEKIQMLVEGWEDGLPDDLKKHGARLRQVAEEVREQSKVKISRFGFINAIINGIVDFGV